MGGGVRFSEVDTLEEFSLKGRDGVGISGTLGELVSVPRILSVLSGSRFVPGVDAHDEGVDDMSPKSGDS